MKNKSTYFLKSMALGSFLLLAFANLPGLSQVKLPSIFSSNMVIQRDTPLTIWGWASPGEQVTLTLASKTYKTKANRDGKWSITSQALKAGGPFQMIVKGKNSLVLENILAGDVWVCSGQSNMEWPVSNSANATEEIDEANYPSIRLFTVPKSIENKPVEDFTGGEWQACSPATIGKFSAVGYYFGRDIHKSQGIPVGLINSSWGGTNVETWIPSDLIKNVPGFEDTPLKLESADFKQSNDEAKLKLAEWVSSIDKKDEGLEGNWHLPSTGLTGWGNMELPRLWESAGLRDLDGVVWFRKEFTLTESDAKTGITIALGPIDDSDVTYLNGIQIGKTIDQYSQPRKYKVEPEVLQPGKNILIVRVIDTGGGGGLYGQPSDLQVEHASGKQSIAGTWQYKVGFESKAPQSAMSGPNALPSLLYNAMIHPMIQYPVKGAIWYQGESNASKAEEYQTLFPLLIESWRSKWNNPTQSFFFVQLANFRNPDVIPGESEWAELREAQDMTLSLPYTGMATAIDIGDAADIHPRNKQDVGRRLALAARKIAYNEDVVHSGPRFKEAMVEGNKLRISFTELGGGLKTKDKYGYVKGFAIAGADGTFHWAKGYVEKNTVIIHTDKVPHPKQVRYGWADNPDDLNLYNIEGLPALPFRASIRTVEQ